MPATDRFPGPAQRPDEPCKTAVAVTPHDTTELTNASRALYVGTGGDLVVILVNDSTAVTFKNVAAGTVLPLRAKIVKSTGTTAANIVALV